MKQAYENMTREELIRELRLISLRRQVTPHFLFNSISVAVSLVLHDTKLAAKFLRLLAEMYRYLLKFGNDYFMPIEKELEMMQRYYSLMSLRHVDSVLLEVTPEVSRLKGHPLPPLALQGLLENAIKHNTHTKEQPLKVTISVTPANEEGEPNMLCISNNIVPLIAKAESTKMGLAYMNETMLLLFNKEITILNDGKTFNVMIPLIEKRKTNKKTCKA